MKRYIRYVIAAFMAVFAIAPLLRSFLLSDPSKPNDFFLAVLNFSAWCIALTYILARVNLHENLSKTARTLGIDTRFKSIDKILELVSRHVDRKNQSFSVSILEKNITSKDELSHTLERLVAQAYKLFNAESAELALFDKSTGLYHSALVLGTPMRTNAQAMLSGAAAEGESESRPDIMIQPLAFAGSVLGTLRVSLKSGVAPALVDQEIMRLLAVQASLALINAQYTSELMRMKRSSDESLKAKTGFLANLSHEIRAPLGVMMNAVELVLDGICGTVSPDQAETLKMVHSNGEHLLELINDVLDYAKVESGKLFPQKVDINVNDLLRDVSNVVRTQAETKSHKLICRVDNDVVAISCDRRHARQMLINLLSNAIKYTPDGGVIEVFLERMPGKKVKLHVRDSGVGIDTADRSKVFAAFERLENSYSRNQVGTGLGMSLTKRLAEVNGASIDFASVPGKGSDFWLLFETVEVSSAIVQEVQDQPVISRGKDELVLIVEREDGERAMLNRYLTHNGYKTLLAANSIEAIELFRGKKIDLAVIDNNMADGTNDDLIRAIRNLPTGSHVPIVLLTSRAFVFDIEKYLKSGIDRCLIKPVKLGDLGITCRQLIDGTFEGEVIDSTEREIVVQDKKEEKKNLKYNTRVITAEERQ